MDFEYHEDEDSPRELRDPDPDDARRERLLSLIIVAIFLLVLFLMWLSGASVSPENMALPA